MSKSEAVKSKNVEHESDNILKITGTQKYAKFIMQK